MTYSISKSKYCKAVQCPKILWLDKYKPELAEDTGSEAVLENGTEVGDLARQYFGDYTLVEFSVDKAAMCAETDRYIKEGKTIIAEASFLYDNCFCSVDLLRVEGDHVDIIEVKSSTDIHDIYYDDMAFQYYVLSNAGYKVNAVYNLHLNREYERKGDLNLEGLFKMEDCTQESKARQVFIEPRLKEIREIIEQKDEPLRELDVYCEDPYECAFKEYCHKDIPENSVFCINRLNKKTKYKYYHEGIISFDDIMNKNPKLSANQYEQVKAVVNNTPPKVDKTEIQNFLNTLSFPMYHLDFETFQQAIPQYDGVKPYMQIPFQYSLHVQRSKDSPEEHYEFLAKEGEDPRRALAESLCKDIPKDVCALAYNMSFEKTVIKNLAARFPDLSDHLMNIHDNMHDLMIPFQKQYYYQKEFQGSYSIKYVLPALCPGDPELNYKALEGVHNGSEAMATYAALPKHTPEEIEVIRKQLLAYCRLDTLAMVKVLEKLYQIVNS